MGTKNWYVPEDDTFTVNMKQVLAKKLDTHLKCENCELHKYLSKNS